MINSIEFYIFAPVLMTLTYFQDLIVVVTDRSKSYIIQYKFWSDWVQILSPCHSYEKMYWREIIFCVPGLGSEKRLCRLLLWMLFEWGPWNSCMMVTSIEFLHVQPGFDDLDLDFQKKKKKKIFLYIFPVLNVSRLPLLFSSLLTICLLLKWITSRLSLWWLFQSDLINY